MRSRLFIINPAAGAGRALSIWRHFEPELSSHGLEGNYHVTSSPGEALEFVARKGPDYDTIVAVGGDGTVFEVVSGLLKSGKPPAALGIIPCGTGNDIAQGLGIISTERALTALKANSPRVLDSIAITCRNGDRAIQRHALMFAAAGIVGLQLRLSTRRMKRILGRSLAYRLAAVRALLAYRAPEVQVQCDGQLFQGSFLYIGAHNTESFGGGMRVAPGAAPDDGLLNVNLVSSIGRLDAIRQFRRVCRGTHVEHPSVRYLTAANVSIQSAEPVDVAADGDVIGFTPAQFSIRPRSLSILAPG